MPSPDGVKDKPRWRREKERRKKTQKLLYAEPVVEKKE